MPCPRPLFGVIMFSYLLPLAPSEVPSSPAASLRFVSPSFQHASSQAAVPPDGGTALPGIVSSLSPPRSSSRHAVGGRRRLQARLFADVSPHAPPVWQSPPAASGQARARSEPTCAAPASPSTAGWAVRRLHGREPAWGASVDLGAGSGTSARGWVDDGGDVCADERGRELADTASPGTGGMGGAPFAGPVEMAEDESDDLDDDPEGMDVVAVCHPPFRPPPVGPQWEGSRLRSFGAMVCWRTGSHRLRRRPQRSSVLPRYPWERFLTLAAAEEVCTCCNARTGWRGG